MRSSRFRENRSAAVRSLGTITTRDENASPESASVVPQIIRAAVIHVNACFPSRARSVSSVPTYDSNGVRLRNYSLAAIEQLLRTKRCAVKRSAKTGRITSAQLFPLPQNSSAVGGKDKLRKNWTKGQSYSYPEQVDQSGRKAWRFVELLTPRAEESELFLMKVFRAVPLSCMEPEEVDEIKNHPAAVEFEPTPPRPAKVITMRPRRPAPPCDSELMPLAS